MKLKRARTLMAISLVSVCGWVAVVGLVIKPSFWHGAILAIIGGIVIGTVVAYLIRRWWFIPKEDMRGISVIEALIIIAILAILAAVLVPRILGY